MKMIMSEEAFQGRPDNLFTRLRTMGERRGAIFQTIFLCFRRLQNKIKSKSGIQKNSICTTELCKTLVKRYKN